MTDNYNIYNHGYLQNTKTGKLLHRELWEKEHGEIPKGFDVHHKNENKLDNSLENLELISHSEHLKRHNSKENNPNWDKKFPLDFCKKHSKRQNSSGFFRVTKQFCKKCKQGFVWSYRYYDENHKRINITANTLEELKEKVLSRNLEWFELNN